MFMFYKYILKMENFCHRMKKVNVLVVKYFFYNLGKFSDVLEHILIRINCFLFSSDVKVTFYSSISFTALSAVSLIIFSELIFFFYLSLDSQVV